MEAWLQRRKLPQLRDEALATGSEEAILDAEVCKGHMGAHGRLIRAEFDRRRDARLAPGNPTEVR
jgi:hypothetical protein